MVPMRYMSCIDCTERIVLYEESPEVKTPTRIFVGICPKCNCYVEVYEVFYNMWRMKVERILTDEQIEERKEKVEELKKQGEKK